MPFFLTSYNHLTKHIYSTFQKYSIYLFSHTKKEKERMAQQIRYLLPFFVFMLSFISCYSTLQKDPRFKDVIKQSTHVLRLKRFDRILGTISTSGKTINVNDYGAKGDGTDDTEVYSFIRVMVDLNSGFWLSCYVLIFCNLIHQGFFYVI